MGSMDCGVVVGGKYRLVEQLGEGGMGSVWRAQHVVLRRSVAVKFIRTDRSTPEATDRFLREAQAAARVQHRNVIDIIDYGTTDDGQPYMVMEHLRGQTLTEWLDRRPAPSVGEIADVMASALVGLEAVHEAGLVHRDLKPDNIFLSRESDAVVPKLLDFGVSRILDSATVLTVPGTILGTPLYMSPEQALGSQRIDLRSDIWSIGVILYRALAGRPPFAGKDLSIILTEIVTGDLVPLTSLRPDLPAALVRVVEGALCRDPGQRFQTARELRETLLAAVARSPEDDGAGGVPTARLLPPASPTEPSAAAPDSTEPQATAPDRTDRAAAAADRTESLTVTPAAISVATGIGRGRRRAGWAVAVATLLLLTVAAAVVAWVGGGDRQPEAASIRAAPTVTTTGPSPDSEPAQSQDEQATPAPATGTAPAAPPAQVALPVPPPAPPATSPATPPRGAPRTRPAPAKAPEKLPILDSPGF